MQASTGHVTVYSLKDIYLYLMPFSPWLANISKPHLCVAVSIGHANLVHSRAVAECIQCWSCRMCEATASLHTCCFFFFPTTPVETMCSTCTTRLYSLFTFLNMLLLEQYKWGPHIFQVLDKPLLGFVIQTVTNVGVSVPLTPSRGSAFSRANDNNWYNGFAWYCGPSPWGGTKQPNDHLLSWY